MLARLPGARITAVELLPEFLGVRAWRRFLKPDGVMVVAEITLTTASRPPDIESHWSAEYPEIGMASEKIAALERNDYSPLGYFFPPCFF